MVDKEVEAKLDKLCDRYNRASSLICGLRPPRLPTPREQQRILGRATGLLGELRGRRVPEATALVKLAYVRGLREVVPGMRLDETRQQEVDNLVSLLNQRLTVGEDAALMSVSGHFRTMRVARSLEEMNTSPAVVRRITDSDRTFPLEQYARTSVRSIAEMASIAGALAGTKAGSYDGEQNVIH